LPFRPEVALTYTSRTPTTASEIVEYLWREAYPGGAKPTEALRFFAEDITCTHYIFYVIYIYSY